MRGASFPVYSRPLIAQRRSGPSDAVLAPGRPLQSSSFSGTGNSPVRCSHTKHWETDMLKGGLLWLIGIPLPIILILFFMGYLS